MVFRRGAISLHGPHHVAQKSTSTGLSACTPVDSSLEAKGSLRGKSDRCIVHHGTHLQHFLLKGILCNVLYTADCRGCPIACSPSSAPVRPSIYAMCTPEELSTGADWHPPGLQCWAGAGCWSLDKQRLGDQCYVHSAPWFSLLIGLCR